jgi:hypothetical protein
VYEYTGQLKYQAHYDANSRGGGGGGSGDSDQNNAVACITTRFTFVLFASKLDHSLFYSQLAMEAHNMTCLNPAKGLNRVVKKNVILYELR